MTYKTQLPQRAMGMVKTHHFMKGKGKAGASQGSQLRGKASSDDAVFQTESIQDWLLPQSAQFPGLRVVRSPTWDSLGLQSVVDRIQQSGTFGREELIKREINLSQVWSSNEGLAEELARAAAELLEPVKGIGLPDDLAAQIQNDAEEVGTAVAKLVPTADKLILKLELMQKHVCIRWHQDYYVARAIVSYNCIGTEYVHDDYVDFYELDNCGNNDHIVPDRTPVRWAGVGDIFLMKGKMFPGPVHGLVHRSPDHQFHTDGRIKTRLVLKVDVSSIQ